MGMFDYLYCDYPLPGKKLEFITEFQTKDLDCSLSAYRITADGNLYEQDGRPLTLTDCQNFTGDIDFYGSNTVAGALGHQFTENGEDVEEADYKAVFVNGTLTELKQTHYRRCPALGRKDIPECDFRKGSGLDENESLIGRELFLFRGHWGGYLGESITVIAETVGELCIKNQEGRLEVLDRRLVTHLLYPSREAAQADHDREERLREQAKAELDRKLEEKISQRSNQ